MPNKRAVETLGMSHGAAANRLRKMVLFRQLQKYSDDVCVRCGSKIECIEELSIEHIKPWEGRSAELFWDLDNVAFSHMKCNVPHLRRGGEPKRIVGISGTSWCTSCRVFHLVEGFSKDSTRWNGLRASCREQMKVYKEKYHSTVGLAAMTPLS